MKIKTKKQLTLPQLIEWGWGNPSLSRNKRFFSKDENLGITKHCVHFNDFGHPEVDNRYCLEPTDTFTIEVEEEITEDTRLDKLVVRYRNDDIYIFPQERIDDFKNDSNIVAFYIPNDDLTLTLIWRDGKLIE